MITYQRSKTWPIVGVIALVAIAGGAYWWSGSHDEPSGVVLAEAQGGMRGWIQPNVGNDDPSALLKPQVLDDGRPADIQSEDWAALNSALAKQGTAKAEAQRIVGYLRYQHNFESWQTLDETKDIKKRQRMAQALLAELPDRLATGEFTAIEANLMGAVLLADLETDETKRNQRLEAWQGKLNGISPLTEDEQQLQAKTRQTELKRRLAGAFAEWQAKTVAAERTQAKLEQALAEVQRAYNSGEF